jgi:hypothetical protein
MPSGQPNTTQQKAKIDWMREMNAFNVWRKTNPAILSDEISLWHGLMALNNSCGWKPEFTVAISTICEFAGLSRSAAYRSLKKLVDAGRLKITARAGNQAALYEIIRFVSQGETQISPEPETASQTDTQTEIQNPGIVSQPETQNETASQVVSQNASQNASHPGIILKRKETKIEEESAPPPFLENENLVGLMLSDWKEVFPGYPDDQQKDFPALLSIGYKIGKSLGLTKHDVLNGSQPKILESFQKVLKTVSDDSWYSKYSISQIDKHWQGLYQTHKAKKKDPVKPSIRKTSEWDEINARNKAEYFNENDNDDDDQ